MEENLVIVESPAKAKTIEKFLGNSFTVKSSYGHIRDLSKKNLGIDLEHNFQPDYIVSEDKKKVVQELKKLSKEAKTIWLASDEDREGEAIAWHLAEVLGLKKNNTKRIVFNEITKDAILKAIKNPRDIDKNLVDAQQARRILDRLVGFELSPVLWKKVKPSLSAGRVQSVAVRLLVDREREIIAFKPSSAFKVYAEFEVKDKNNKTTKIQAELSDKFKTKEEAKKFLESCNGAEFRITDIVTKPAKKSPAPPFTTSTLQQEASRKLGFSVAQTMTVAQKLYEAGKITYMRTDSVNLSETALNAAQEVITKEFGDKYYQLRQYKTKTKGAQEAHEAIRPAYMADSTIQGNNSEKRLYELIWKRTVASQMSDAAFERTNVTIGISTNKYNFNAEGEVLKFEGFLKVYHESSDEEEQSDEIKGFLPPLALKQQLFEKSISAIEKFTHHPARYTEASLVKKLEELGIGRPSTYAPIISTIQNRGYVSKEDRPGIERNYSVLTLEKGAISDKTEKENTGAEKAKLFPTDIGMVVNDYLLKHFKEIMDFNFTASVEKQFDEIATGKVVWNNMIGQFYKPFHKKVDDATTTQDSTKGERLLGNDPETGKPVSVRIGRFGPMVQIGNSHEEEKPRYARLQSGQYLETITLEQALNLFRLPKKLGKYEDADVSVGIGRFGPYVQHKSKFYSLIKGVDDPYEITLERAIELIEAKREKDKNKIIKEFEDKDGVIQVLNGRWGPYIARNKENFKIPKGKEPKELTLADCLEIIKKSADTPKKAKRFTRKSK